MLHNAIPLGGIDAALEDFLTIALHRSGLVEEVIPLGVFLDIWFWRLGGYSDYIKLKYPILDQVGVAVCILLLVLVLLQRRNRSSIAINRGIQNACILTLAGGAWLAVMRQFSFIHAHTVMLL